MTTQLKNARKKPAAGNALETLVTVQDGSSIVVSTLFACNTSGTDTTFCVTIDPSGGTDPSHYIFKDLPIAANDTFAVTAGMVGMQGDLIQVSSGSGAVAFNISYQENIS